MHTTVTPSVDVWQLIKTVFKRPTRPASPLQAAHDLAQETRDRRDFINEALRRDPGAFASELDVQFMMQAYPNRF